MNYFVNSNFKDFDLCRTDFIYSRLKIFCKNSDSLLDELNELRFIIETSCHDVAVMTEVLPKNSFFLRKSVFYLDGYQLFWNSDYYEASRGISIYVRSYISATIYTNLTCGGLHRSVWFCISLMKGDSLLLGCIYKSSSSFASNNDNLIDLLKMLGKTRHLIK